MTYVDVLRHGPTQRRLCELRAATDLAELSMSVAGGGDLAVTTKEVQYSFSDFVGTIGQYSCEWGFLTQHRYILPFFQAVQ